MLQEQFCGMLCPTIAFPHRGQCSENHACLTPQFAECGVSQFSFLQCSVLCEFIIVFAYLKQCLESLVAVLQFCEQLVSFLASLAKLQSICLPLGVGFDLSWDRANLLRNLSSYISSLKPSEFLSFWTLLHVTRLCCLTLTLVRFQSQLMIHRTKCLLQVDHALHLGR